MKIKRNPKVVFSKVGDKTVLLDPEKGILYFLNETASFLWQKLKRQTNTSSLKKAIVKEFEVDEERAEEDVKEFISNSLKRKLLTSEGKKNIQKRKKNLRPEKV